MPRPLRRERLLTELALLETPDLIDELCEHQAEGQGLTAWCAAADVRYSTIRAWIDVDPDRAAKFEAAERHRADRAAAAIDAMGQKLLNPLAVTGHPWVDQLAALDSKASRVALDALKWSALTNAPKRYGRSVEHHHTHRLADEHLAALRTLMKGKTGVGGPAAPAMIEGEVVVVDRDAEMRALHRPFIVPLQPEPVPSAVPARGDPVPKLSASAFKIPLPQN